MGRNDEALEKAPYKSALVFDLYGVLYLLRSCNGSLTSQGFGEAKGEGAEGRGGRCG